MATERNGRGAASVRRQAAERTAGERELASPPSFERALEQLDAILEQLETGQIELDAALALYEEGVRLAQRCQRQLDEADLRVERLRAETENTGADGAAAFSVEAFEVDER